jgi:hypothetical protein
MRRLAAKLAAVDRSVLRAVAPLALPSPAAWVPAAWASTCASVRLCGGWRLGRLQGMQAGLSGLRLTPLACGGSA